VRIVSTRKPRSSGTTENPVTASHGACPEEIPSSPTFIATLEKKRLAGENLYER
jgi:hypothetical protein